MALGGNLGVAAALELAPSNVASLSPHALAYSESLGRLVVEVAPESKDAFRATMNGSPFELIGNVTNGSRLKFTAYGQKVADVTLTQLTDAFRGHLTEAA